MIVHILHMYNSNHPPTLYESLPYVQHSYNRSLHSPTAHSPFQVGLGFQPLCLIDVPCHLWLLRLIRLMSSLNLTKKTPSSSAFNTSANRFMKYWTEPMLSTSNAMINIRCHTTSRWATKYGYICRRRASVDPTASFTCSDTSHTPSPRL